MHRSSADDLLSSGLLAPAVHGGTHRYASIPWRKPGRTHTHLMIRWTIALSTNVRYQCDLQHEL